MKKNIIVKIICILAILFCLFFSSQLAFASDDFCNPEDYDLYCPNWMYGKVYVTKYNNVPVGLNRVFCICNYKGSQSIYPLFYDENFRICSSPNYSVFSAVWERGYNFFSSSGSNSTPACFKVVNSYVTKYPVCDLTSIGNIDDYTYLEGKDVRDYIVSNGGLDFISGNNYDKNGFTNYSSDIYYPVPMSISYCNDVEDLVNYDRFYMSFNILPENCRYSNTSFYDLELWVLNSDRRIYVKSYPLSGLQYQTHSGGGSWGSDSGGKSYYVLDEKLHDSISFLDELDSPLTLEFRLVYRINDTSYLESGYVDVSVDLASGSILSVNYYDDGMKEDDVVNDNPEVLPEVVQPSNPNGYVFNIDWENSNLDDFVRQNFGIKNYIIALKDTLSFLPDFFWTMQFFLLGAISSIGIYKLCIK